MSDSRPIGVFDSGIGGLTVVKALRDLLPNENIFYLGDTARVPYGPKSPETVQRYAVELAGMLMGKNAKALVVACNTVSSVALPLLTQKFSVPVIGVIEPGARTKMRCARQRAMCT
jgi:glutamate racemase